jgi:tetratricopeptide (TPR) repeat protein
LLEKIPFFLIGAASAVITVISQSGDTELKLPIEHPIAGAPLVICHNIIFYLYKILWPADLSFYYPFPSPMGLSNPMVAAGLIGTLILLPLLVLSWRWSRAPSSGWLFFFVAISPTIGFMGFTFVVASDKYAYLPVVGLFMALAYFLAKIWDLPTARRTRLAVRTGLIVLVVLAAGLEFKQTRRFLAPWRSSEDLFRHMLRHAPDAVPIHYGLATFLMQEGKTDEAVEHLETVLRANPGHWKALTDLGEINRRRGLADKAIEYFQAALRAQPEYLPALNNLGAAYADQGRYQEAIALYDRTLQIAPRHRSAYINKGNALNALGRYEEALAQYNEALRITPDHPRTYYNRALALRNLGRIDEAIRDFREALRLDPDYASARKQLDLTMKEKH